MKPSPTMPTLMVRFSAISCGKFGDEIAGGFDVLNALVAGFTLNTAKAREAQFVERVEKCLPIHFARADRDLLTPFARFFRANAVFDVDLLQSLPECVQRVNRITAVVENHVGGIEVHADVRPVELDEEKFQIVCVFLTGFKGQFKTFAFK